MGARFFTRQLLLVLCVLAVAATVRAQSSLLYSFTIGNAFSAASKSLPAGHYELRSDGAGGFILSGGKEYVRVPVLTRLARTAPADAPPRFVFDALDTGEQMLSEIWLPGEDGYLVCVLEKEHHHVVLEAQKKMP